MSKRSKASGKTTGDRRDRRKELAELIREASKQPGIQRLREVYEQCAPYEAAMRAHQQFLGTPRVVILSNSSSGSLLRSN